MKDTLSVTIRLERDLMRALRMRAVMNDRSANGELKTILREALKFNSAAGTQPEELNPAA